MLQWDKRGGWLSAGSLRASRWLTIKSKTIDQSGSKFSDCSLFCPGCSRTEAGPTGSAARRTASFAVLRLLPKILQQSLCEL